MSDIFLLAYGQQLRLPDLGHPKQFLPLGAETIIGRTVRLLREWGQSPILVAPGTDVWLEFARESQLARMDPLQTGETVVETLKGLPSAGTFLLGDVVYSRACLQHLARALTLTFVGRTGPSSTTGKPWGEVFGVHVPPVWTPRVETALHELPNGKLWDLKRQLGDLATWVEIDDYTDDVDLPDDIELILRFLLPTPAPMVDLVRRVRPPW